MEDRHVEVADRRFDRELLPETDCEMSASDEPQDLELERVEDIANCDNEYDGSRSPVIGRRRKSLSFDRHEVNHQPPSMSNRLSEQSDKPMAGPSVRFTRNEVLYHSQNRAHVPSSNTQKPNMHPKVVMSSYLNQFINRFFPINGKVV